MPVPGEFDNDEPNEILENIRLSKRTAPKARRVGVSRLVPSDALELPSPLSDSGAVPPLVRRTQQVSVLPQFNYTVTDLTALQMGIKLVTMSSSHTHMGDSNTNNRRVRTRKATPTNLDLPLPPGSEYQTKWTKIYVSQLCAWAGSTGDPFGTNGKMANKIEVIWKRVFPDVVLEEEDKPVVIKVVRALS